MTIEIEPIKRLEIYLQIFKQKLLPVKRMMPNTMTFVNSPHVKYLSPVFPQVTGLQNRQQKVNGLLPVNGTDIREAISQIQINVTNCT